MTNQHTCQNGNFGKASKNGNFGKASKNQKTNTLRPKQNDHHFADHIFIENYY